MLVRFSDGLDRQEQHREFVGQPGEDRVDHALHDRGVGHDRQMRAVLLDRRDGQHGNRRIRIEPRKLARLQLAPESFSRHDFTFGPYLAARRAIV